MLKGHAGTDDGWTPSLHFKALGTWELSPAVWDGLNLGQAGFSLASGSSSPHSTQHSGTSAAGMGNGEGGGAGGEEKGQAAVLPL